MTVGAGGTLRLDVTAGRIGIGSLSDSISFDFACVTAVMPPNVPATGRVSMTLYGLDFAVSHSSIESRLGFTGAEASDWSSATSVRCKSAAGTNLPAGDLHVVVTALVKVGTLSQAFTFNSPISSFIPANQPTRGRTASLTMFGSDFGMSGASLAGRFGPTACESSGWTSDSSMTCLAAAGTFASLSAAVTVADAVDSASTVLSYDMPRLASVESDPQVNTTVLIAKGSNIGTFQASQAGRMAATACEATEWISNTMLACRTRAWIADSEAYGKVVVTSGRMVGSLSGAAAYHGRISALHRSNFHHRGGEVVVFGLGFGLIDSSINVRITGSSAESSTWLSHTTVACSCSSGISNIVSSLIVTISRKKSTYSPGFSYDKISLSSVQASNLRSWSYVGLSVIGVNVGGFDLSPRVRLGGSDAVSSVWISDTCLLCKLSPGFHENPQLVVTLASQQSTMSGCTSYDIPSILLTQAIRSRLESEASRWIADTSVKCNSVEVQFSSRRIIRDAHFKRLRYLDTAMQRLKLER